MLIVVVTLSCNSFILFICFLQSLAERRETTRFLVGLVDGDDPLVGLEVGTAGTSLVSHPHPLCLAPLGLGSLHVRQNNDTVKAMLVDVIGGSIEASAAAGYPLSLLALPLLPDVDLILWHLSVEGHDRELCQLCQLVEFSEEVL